MVREAFVNLLVNLLCLLVPYLTRLQTQYIYVWLYGFPFFFFRFKSL